MRSGLSSRWVREGLKLTNGERERLAKISFTTETQLEEVGHDMNPRTRRMFHRTSLIFMTRCQKPRTMSHSIERRKIQLPSTTSHTIESRRIHQPSTTSHSIESREIPTEANTTVTGTSIDIRGCTGTALMMSRRDTLMTTSKNLSDSLPSSPAIVKTATCQTSNQSRATTKKELAATNTMCTRKERACLKRVSSTFTSRKRRWWSQSSEPRSIFGNQRARLSRELSQLFRPRTKRTVGVTSDLQCLSKIWRKDRFSWRKKRRSISPLKRSKMSLTIWQATSRAFQSRSTAARVYLMRYTQRRWFHFQLRMKRVTSRCRHLLTKQSSSYSPAPL